MYGKIDLFQPELITELYNNLFGRVT